MAQSVRKDRTDDRDPPMLGARRRAALWREPYRMGHRHRRERGFGRPGGGRRLTSSRGEREPMSQSTIYGRTEDEWEQLE